LGLKPPLTPVATKGGSGQGERKEKKMELQTEKTQGRGRTYWRLDTVSLNGTLLLRGR